MFFKPLRHEQKYYVFKNGHDKICRLGVDEENPQKNIFFGFSETTQANFIWALIFWSFLIKKKGHK